MRTTPPKETTPSDYQEIKASISDTSTNVTPVYWSASQLLSKLDHNNSSATSSNNPKMTYYVQNGQPQSLLQQQPNVHPQLNLHNSMPVCNRGEIQPHIVGLQSREQTQNNSSMPLWSYRVRDIPEEYTVTVSDMVMDDHMVLSDNPPPGVVPKPRNITQV